MTPRRRLTLVSDTVEPAHRCDTIPAVDPLPGLREDVPVPLRPAPHRAPVAGGCPVSSTASRWIDSRISNALARAFEQIDRYQRDGYCTEQDVLDALSLGWDEAVVEGWREWKAEEEL
jgi:hypothetical protein